MSAEAIAALLAAHAVHGETWCGDGRGATHEPEKPLRSEADYRAHLADVIAEWHAEQVRAEKAEAWIDGWAAPEGYPLDRNPYARADGPHAVPDHECDAGHFDRTLCACGAMHSYCTVCENRVDDCPYDQDENGDQTP